MSDRLAFGMASVDDLPDLIAMTLTELGLTVAAERRAHKDRGGRFASFQAIWPDGKACTP